MNNKLLIILTFLLLHISTITSQEVLELNTRAEADIFRDPSSSIYYAENAIDNNIDRQNTEEYIKSLYILMRSYNRLGDLYMVDNLIDRALSFLKSKGYNNGVSDFYIYCCRFLYEAKKIEKLNDILSNESIISILDNRGLIEFNIIKLYLSTIEDIDSSIIEQSIALCNTNGFIELESELHIFYGDYIVDKDITKARSHYKKVTEITNSNFLVEANIRLGQLSGSIEYLEQALLASEQLDDNQLSLEVLDLLHIEYLERLDYKNLTSTIDKQKYFNDKYNLFLTKQYQKLYNFSYYKEKATLELEESNSLNSLLITFVISLGAALIVLIILLSIQTYRLRGYNL